ncbi:MAG: hypothetical protein JST52_10265 [Bacteroidetes bacterium]|nr:hypothetical protein [Bacteroidota bacterium]MBS1739799.1 hypothetical protein [Bacteroidota bacterium]MBS1775939.1 hypothetical protein [Bacteroidota bacterium]
MDINEVPQDSLHYKGRDQLKKLMYAVDQKGHYTGISSVGWEAENEATKQAWDAVEEELQQTKAFVLNGTLSPIAYFMRLKLMDVGLLASYVGKWKWQVKRHLKPKVFKRINSKTLKRYADLFGISVSDLINFGKT